MKKILSVVTLLLLAVTSYAHVWEIRVNQNQNGSLTWYLQSYHPLGQCGIQNSGLTINGVNYPLQSEHAGSIVGLSSNLFAINTSVSTVRGSYAIVNTPFLGTTLSVQPYSNNACWAFLVGGSGNFTPPPPPVCTSCPITGFSNSNGTASNNGTLCDQTDDYIPTTVTVNHLSCASITTGGQFRVVYDPSGANVSYGPYNFSTGITTDVNINLPYGTSNSTQLSVISDNFPCAYTGNLSVPGGTFNGVPETVPPVMSCPSNITVNNSAGNCGAVVNYTEPTATDNCTTCSVPTSLQGYTYIGTYGGHTYFKSNFNATPIDHETAAQALGAHLASINSSGENSFLAGGSTLYWIGFNDAASEGNFVWTSGEPVTYTNWYPGEPNNLGNEDYTVINWGSAGQWNDLPALSGPAIIEFDCVGSGVTPVRTAGPASGSTFPVGTTTVTYKSTDDAGNSSTCSFTVTVNDNEAPSIAAPAAVTANADNGACAATNVALGAPTTGDNCGVASTSNNGPSIYPVGTTTVTWTVTDIHGNTNTATQDVTVVDNQNPTITAPADVTVNADNGACAATNVALGSATTADNCGVASLSNNAQTSYPVGTTVVTWTVTDIHGNSSTANQNVTVVDNQAPNAVCQSYTLNLSNGTGTVLPSDVDGGSTDNCGIGSMTVSPNTFTCADAGTHTVTLTVTDIHGNSSSCNATVLVQYQPSCSITTTPSNNVYTGGNPNTIYLGYGPQSATITANATGGSGFTYSWSPSTGLSSTTAQAPVFTPTAAGTYTYTVTVTNSNGCATTCEVSFCVLDIRVPGNKGKSSGKVYICHAPPGNPNNAQTLSVSVNAVASHLSGHSGDKLGSCDQSCNSSAKRGKNDNNEEVTDNQIGSIEAIAAGFKLYPNPNTGTFTLEMPSEDAATVMITNISGQVVYRNETKGTQRMTITVDNVIPGIYMLHITSGDATYHTKVFIH